MNLHKNKELFSQAVEMTSQHFRIKREFVEKDYRYNNISPQIIIHCPLSIINCPLSIVNY